MNIHNTKKLLITVLLLATLSCSNSNDHANEESQEQTQEEKNSNSAATDLPEAIDEVVEVTQRSCSVDFTAEYAQSAINAEFKDKNQSFAGLSEEFIKIFTYSSKDLSILSTSDFQNNINICILNDSKIELVEKASDCSDIASKTKEDGTLVYENVISVENIQTKFQEFIVLSEINENNKLICEIKLIVNQESKSTPNFSRSSSWIDLNLHIYDQKTSSGHYYVEYAFPAKNNYSQSGQNNNYNPPVRGRDLRTNVTGTGVRE
jgi:hypothetical protein